MTPFPGKVRVFPVKRFPWIILTLLLTVPGLASLPDHSKNGVVRAGFALNRILDDSSADSPVSKCFREDDSLNLFSDSCRALLDQLQKKLALMTLESDIQIQAEKLGRGKSRISRKNRMESLSRLNLVSTQAEDALKPLKSGIPEDQLPARIRKILPDLKKVGVAYQAYLGFLADGSR